MQVTARTIYPPRTDPTPSMCPTTHYRFTRLQATPHGRRALLAVPHNDELKRSVEYHYVCLFAGPVDSYKRSFDYRAGTWYTRTTRLVVYYNVIEQRVDVELTSRVVDTGFVDRITPLVSNVTLTPAQLRRENTLTCLVQPLVRKERACAVQQHVSTIVARCANLREHHRRLVRQLGEKWGVPDVVVDMLLEFV